MKNAPWTPEEKAKLRRLWSEKRTVSAIASALCKSESAVKNQRRFLGLPPRRTGNLAVKVKVGIDKDTFTVLRHKAISNSQSVPARLRELIQTDINTP